MNALNKVSLARLMTAHPLLQKLFHEVVKEAPILIMQSQRGRHDQEKAFAQHHSKVHFGQSAHNWSPAIALDVAPLPLDWSNSKAFLALGRDVVMPLAKSLDIPIRWGADWNMNGNYSDQSFVDMPHYELNPWRDFAKHCKPYGG